MNRLKDIIKIFSIFGGRDLNRLKAINRVETEANKSFSF